jgi:peroxiredoxin
MSAVLCSGSSAAEDGAVGLPPVLLQMIRDESIHQELTLSAAQQQRVIEALQTVDGRWFRSRNLPADPQRQEIEALTDELQSQLEAILQPQQIDRLAQLQRQALGTRMVLRDDVARPLGLTASQRDAFLKSFVETDSQAAQIQQQLHNGEKDLRSANEELERVKAKERQSLVGMLSSEQRSKLGSLTGSPFEFGAVRRMYPLAPELEPGGVSWIQGGPLTIEQLRGKVVAVHFYAFQCINCQRNFPHYKAWHDDYADRGLVIIGIQTPETSAERSLDRVAAAVKSDAMEYPVMLDAEASNWRAWSNTMWPTVYLIDKQGFIRRWWQGEMNWKETLGEQQMRQTIEQLLAEKL